MQGKGKRSGRLRKEGTFEEMRVKGRKRRNVLAKKKKSLLPIKKSPLPGQQKRSGEPYQKRMPEITEYNSVRRSELERGATKEDL